MLGLLPRWEHRPWCDVLRARSNQSQELLHEVGCLLVQMLWRMVSEHWALLHVFPTQASQQANVHFAAPHNSCCSPSGFTNTGCTCQSWDQWTGKPSYWNAANQLIIVK